MKVMVMVIVSESRLCLLWLTSTLCLSSFLRTLVFNWSVFETRLDGDDDTFVQRREAASCSQGLELVFGRWSIK